MNRLRIISNKKGLKNCVEGDILYNETNDAYFIPDLGELKSLIKYKDDYKHLIPVQLIIVSDEHSIQFKQEYMPEAFIQDVIAGTVEDGDEVEIKKGKDGLIIINALNRDVRLIKDSPKTYTEEQVKEIIAMYARDVLMAYRKGDTKLPFIDNWWNENKHKY